MITALTVNYNTPEYLERLLKSFREHYDIPYYVLDGSDRDKYEKIVDFPKKYGIKLIHFDYNIHHGPGMAYGIKNIKTQQLLFIDSDMIILNNGWLDMMKDTLGRNDYGTGDIQKEYYMIKDGNNKDKKGKQAYKKLWIDYLHPALALVNKDVVIRYPMPIKGGAPLINAMYGIYLMNQGHIIKRSQWLTDDFWDHKGLYVQHNHNYEGMGTVKKTGGYHL